MKIKVWVLATCTEQLRPALPRVFGDEGEAEAAYDTVMREEWELHSPEAPDETPTPYPGAREANRQLANGFATGDWCDWELTSHTIEIPLPADIQQLLATMNQSATDRLEDYESGVREGVYDEAENAPVIASLKAAIAEVDGILASGSASGAPDPESGEIREFFASAHEAVVDEAVDSMLASPTFSLADWKREVANGDTRRGYSEWLLAQREQAANENDMAKRERAALVVALAAEDRI